MRLQPIAMIIHNEHCVYSPSQFSPPFEIEEAEFKRRFGQHRHTVRFCPDPVPDAEAIYDRSEEMIAYGFGVDCWYIAEEE